MNNQSRFFKKKKAMENEAKSVKQRFSTRKLSVGMVSVLLGFTFIFGASSTVPQLKANMFTAMAEEQGFTYPNDNPILLQKKGSTDLEIIIPDINAIQNDEGIEVRTTNEKKGEMAMPPLFRITDLKTTPKLVNTFNFIGNGENLFDTNIKVDRIGKNMIITVKDAKVSNLVKMN